MSNLCGFLGSPSGGDRLSILYSMQQRLPAGHGHGAPVALCDLGGVAATSRTPGSVARGTDGVVVAVAGRPRSDKTDLQTVLRAQGTATAVLRAYERDGQECVDRFRGPFAMVVLDPGRQQAFLAIDRMGVHSMVYATTNDGLVFGTTADAVRMHPDVAATISPQAIYRYAVNYVSPAPLTIYEDCRKLLPAYMLVWANGRSEVRRYWRIPYGAEPVSRRPEVLREALFDRLDRAVRRDLESQPGTARPGSFLSGGLDSSAVSGVLRDAFGQRFPAFTITFADATYDESRFAQLAAAHFGLNHHTYQLTAADVADVLPRLAEIFDEPFGNSSVIPAYYCARHARNLDVDVLFAGDGGDEIFAGNKRYVEQKVFSLYHAIPAALRTPLTAILLRVPDRLARSVVGKAKRYVNQARVPMPERMLSSDVYRREYLREIFTDEAVAMLAPAEPIELWRRHYDEAATDDPLYAMLHLDTRITLADNDLRKVGRACELADVDVAYPMLDEDLVEFAASIPSSLLIKNFDLRYFFKRSMTNFLPNDVIHKSKHGFGMPFTEWTRTDPTLWEMVADALSDLKRRGVFRSEFIDRALDAHRRGDSPDLSGVVWDMLVLELWWERRESEPRTSSVRATS